MENFPSVDQSERRLESLDRLPSQASKAEFKSEAHSPTYVSSMAESLAILSKVDSDIPVIVDFDETLFLRNSTEEYLNSLRPRAIAVILLFLLDRLQPWSWLPGLRQKREARNWFRVVVTTAVLPWTMFFWPKVARRLAQEQSNLELIAALNHKTRHQLIVATNGFSMIVRPLLEAMPMNRSRLLACRLWWGGLGDQLNGKLARVQQWLRPEMLRQAVVITESVEDAPLLDAVHYPCLVTWPDAQFLPALSNTYIPFVYLEKGKHPGERFFARVVLYESWTMLVIGISLIDAHPFTHSLALFFLLLSFWCIYEVGYIENDLAAEKYESNPKLSDSYRKYIKRYDPWSPWVWSLLFAIPGLFVLTVLEAPQLPDLLHFFQGFDLVQFVSKSGVWIGLLIVLRLTYHVYNLVSVESRIWIYPVLQLYKKLGFALLCSVSLGGVMFFASYILARSAPYVIYRRGGNRKNFPEQMVWLVLFVLLLGAVGISRSEPLPVVFNWQTALMLGWLSFKSRHEIASELKSIKLIGPLI